MINIKVLLYDLDIDGFLYYDAQVFCKVPADSDWETI